jgi:hypothetical protein
VTLAIVVTRTARAQDVVRATGRPPRHGRHAKGGPVGDGGMRQDDRRGRTALHRRGGQVASRPWKADVPAGAGLALRPPRARRIPRAGPPGRTRPVPAHAAGTEGVVTPTRRAGGGGAPTDGPPDGVRVVVKIRPAQTDRHGVGATNAQTPVVPGGKGTQGTGLAIGRRITSAALWLLPERRQRVIVGRQKDVARTKAVGVGHPTAVVRREEDSPYEPQEQQEQPADAHHACGTT